MIPTILRLSTLPVLLLAIIHTPMGQMASLRAWEGGDLATNSAYNQSAVWSEMCSPAPSIHTFRNGFDGSTTTTFAGGISAGSYFTFTPTGGLAFTNNVRVYNGAVSAPLINTTAVQRQLSRPTLGLRSQQAEEQ